MSEDCQGLEGKTSWPELVGVKGTDAKVIIERENPFVKAQIIDEKAITLRIFLCDNVYVRVNRNGIVSQVPHIG